MERVSSKLKICVVGLGYVGIPLAIAFDKVGVEVIGYDTDIEKIIDYRKNIDRTGEVGTEALRGSRINFTSDSSVIAEANVYIVTVPTPIEEESKEPNLSCLKEATMTIGQYLNKGDYVIFESTVAPTTTEMICVPILESSSKSSLTYKQDYMVGYSPERVAPATSRKMEDIVKIVAGCTDEATEFMHWLYSLVIRAGVYKAKSIRVAESSKMLENIQRDVNIALMNEMTMIFSQIGVQSRDVLEAAETKWNFIKGFEPGLVGGHCISVDPYYMIKEASFRGLKTPLIESARSVNEEFPLFIVDEIINYFKGETFNKNIGVFGVTYKEDCGDLRNSKSIDVIRSLKEVGFNVFVSDDVVGGTCGESYLKDAYDIDLVPSADMENLDMGAILVKHDIYCADYFSDIDYRSSNKPMIDVKHACDKDEMKKHGFYTYTF